MIGPAYEIAASLARASLGLLSGPQDGPDLLGTRPPRVDVPSLIPVVGRDRPRVCTGSVGDRRVADRALGRDPGPDQRPGRPRGGRRHRAAGLAYRRPRGRCQPVRTAVTRSDAIRRPSAWPRSMPVAIGRTRRRGPREHRPAAPMLRVRGDPATTGIFGTLETCPGPGHRPARAGITDLRCIIPSTLDVHACHRASSPPSPSAPPTPGWPGRC